jgi:hypothetical protein
LVVDPEKTSTTPDSGFQKSLESWSEAYQLDDEPSKKEGSPLVPRQGNLSGARLAKLQAMEMAQEEAPEEKPKDEPEPEPETSPDVVAHDRKTGFWRGFWGL